MGSVCAVVVTHNRKAMLRRCLSALAAQRRPPERILVVDNASTDGTGAMVEREYDQVELLALAANEGGAGGFHEGMKRAHTDGAEWLWLMDDDTIPSSEALAELLAVAERDLEGVSVPTLLASKIVWRNWSAHPMNFPTLERRAVERVIAGAEHGVMPMRSATFVSLLVHRGVVDRHGLPLKRFFLWSDDIEYTSRAVHAGERAYFVPASMALHDTDAPGDYRSAEPDRFYLHARNTLFMARGPNRPPRDRLLRVWIFVASSVAYLAKNRSRRSAAAVLRAIRDGFGRSA